MSFLGEAGKFLKGGGAIGEVARFAKPLEKASGIGMIREKLFQEKEKLPGQKKSYSSDGVLPEIGLGDM